MKVNITFSGISTEVLVKREIHIEVKRKSTDCERYQVFITPVWPVLGSRQAKIVLSKAFS